MQYLRIIQFLYIAIRTPLINIIKSKKIMAAASSFRWIHRDRLKSTAPVRFEQGRLASGAANKEAKDLLV